MQSKIGLYFQLEANDQITSLSLVKQAINGLEQLEKKNMDVEYFELRIRELDEIEGDKQAYIKLDGEGNTFIDSGKSVTWDGAFKNAFEKVAEKLVAASTA